MRHIFTIVVLDARKSLVIIVSLYIFKKISPILTYSVLKIHINTYINFTYKKRI